MCDKDEDVSALLQAHEDPARRAVQLASQALQEAEAAFFDPSMTLQDYFPDEYIAAVYLPLLLPLALPLILGFLREWKRLREKKKEKAARKKAKEECLYRNE